MNFFFLRRFFVILAFLAPVSTVVACSSSGDDGPRTPVRGGSASVDASGGPAADFRPTESIALTGAQLGVSTLRVILAPQAASVCAEPNVTYASSRFMELDLVLGDQKPSVKVYDVASREAEATLFSSDAQCKPDDGPTATEGTITIIDVSATSVSGKFSVVLGGVKTEGTFSTSICNVDDAAANLRSDAQKVCR